MQGRFLRKKVLSVDTVLNKQYVIRWMVLVLRDTVNQDGNIHLIKDAMKNVMKELTGYNVVTDVDTVQKEYRATKLMGAASEVVKMDGQITTAVKRVRKVCTERAAVVPVDIV
ncbi:uncharacterized protein LOC134268100 [Saccostrea cucullata]|uniref:uncharacterized protein LOC134268100 n=1 Tax=Saccostrea cuccullata TaxID=36930 RepID=UPI002ED6B7A3